MTAGLLPWGSGGPWLGSRRRPRRHAVPITFGFKPTGWIDELDRHVSRLRSAEGRVFTAMTGGVAGTLASLGRAGPQVQNAAAAHLGLTPMTAPSRAIADSFAEYSATYLDRPGMPR
jgi:3-carboxy-cis,cis-muconate cycloisomerase